MKPLRNNTEFKQYKLALGRWESEGGAPAPYLAEAPERQDNRSDPWAAHTQRQAPQRFPGDRPTQEQASHLQRA